VWLTAAPQELTSTGQAEPGPLLAAVTAALREIIHRGNTWVALSAGAKGLEHIHFRVVPRTDHPDPSFRGPFAFAPLGGDTATQIPGQVRDQITSKLAAAASLRAQPGPRDEESQPLAPPKARRAAAWRATSGMESKASQEAAGTADPPILYTHTSHHCRHLEVLIRRLRVRKLGPQR